MLARTKKKMAKQLQRRQKRKFRFWADRSKTICKNHHIDCQWDDLNWHSHPQKSPVFDPRKGNRKDAKDTLEKHLCKDSIMKSGFINLSLQGKVYKTSLHNTVNIQCVQNCERPKLKTLDSLGLPRTHWKGQCVTIENPTGSGWTTASTYKHYHISKSCILVLFFKRYLKQRLAFKGQGGLCYKILIRIL